MTTHDLWEMALKALAPVTISAAVSGSVATYFLMPTRNVVFVPRYVQPDVICKLDRAAMPAILSRRAGNGPPDTDDATSVRYITFLHSLVDNHSDNIAQSQVPPDFEPLLTHDKLLDCNITGNDAHEQFVVRVDAVALFKQADKYAIERLCEITFDGQYTLPALVSQYDEDIPLDTLTSIEIFKHRSPLVVDPYKPLILQYKPALAGRLKNVSGDELVELKKTMDTKGKTYQVSIVCDGVGTKGKIRVGEDAAFKVRDGALTS
jgi:hypothetical protein